MAKCAGGLAHVLGTKTHDMAHVMRHQPIAKQPEHCCLSQGLSELDQAIEPEDTTKAVDRIQPVPLERNGTRPKSERAQHGWRAYGREHGHAKQEGEWDKRGANQTCGQCRGIKDSNIAIIE